MWVRSLNIIPKTIKLLREIFYDFGVGNNFSIVIAKAQATKGKIGKLDLIKI